MPPKNLSRAQILSAIRLHHLLSAVADYHHSQPPSSFLEGDAEAGAYWTLGSLGVESSSFRWDVHGLVGVGVDSRSATARVAHEAETRPLQYLTGLPSDLEPLALAAAAALENRVTAGCWIGRDQRGFIAQKHTWNGIIHLLPAVANDVAMIVHQQRLDEPHGTVAEEIITAAGLGHAIVTEEQAAILLDPPLMRDNDDDEWPSPYSVSRLRCQLRRRNIHWPAPRAEPRTSSESRRSLHRAFRRHALLWALERQSRDPLLTDHSVETRVLFEGDDREGLFCFGGFRAHWNDAGLLAFESGNGAALDSLPSNLQRLAFEFTYEVDFFHTEDRVVTLAPSLGPHSTSLLEGSADPLEAFDLPEALVHLTARLVAAVEDFVTGQPLVSIAPSLADELLAALPHPPPTREAARALQWALARVGLSWAIPPAVYPVPAEVPPAPFPEVDDIDEAPSIATGQTVEPRPLDGTVPALGTPPIFTPEEQQDAPHVYGDWLEQQGHPLGRWVALHRALEHEHSDEIVHSLTQMSEQYGEHLLPTLDQTPEWPAYVLRSGLIHAARIMPHDQRTPLAARVRRLLSHPAALLIRGLVIGHGLSRDILGLSAAVDALAEAPRCLDALYLVQSAGVYPSSALVEGRLWAARPHLRKLILALTECALGPIDAPHLEHLGLRLSLQEAVARDLTAAPFPSLTTLDIEAPSYPLALLPNLVAPRLRELRLGAVGRPLLIHELDALCAWPGFQSLRILQLSDPSSNDGCFDGSFLHAFAQRFAHLEEIRLVPTRFGAFSSVEGVHPYRIMHPSRSVREGDPLLSLCP